MLRKAWLRDGRRFGDKVVQAPHMSASPHGFERQLLQVLRHFPAAACCVGAGRCVERDPAEACKVFLLLVLVGERRNSSGSRRASEGLNRVVKPSIGKVRVGAGNYSYEYLMVFLWFRGFPRLRF